MVWMGDLTTKVSSHIVFFPLIAPPRILVTRYSSIIYRMNLDGSYLTTVYSTTYPRALDFDYRYQVKTPSLYVMGVYIVILTIT